MMKRATYNAFILYKMEKERSDEAKSMDVYCLPYGPNLSLV